MAREVARRWLQERAHPEFRLAIYGSSIRNLPGLLRAFRDGRRGLIGCDLKSIPDLGIQENFDSVVVWSTNRQALLQLLEWVESRGVETSGIW